MSDIIRCSSLSRVMNCKGCQSFNDLYVEPAGEAADQGTAAGEYLERLLTRKFLGTHASNGFPFDDDMKYYLTPVYEDIMAKSGGRLLCEERIDWTAAGGTTIRGQYDVGYECGNNLHIDDLKYGYGIVEVKENWQLLGYAIGKCIQTGRAYDKIVLRIIQPRPHHEDGVFRKWVLSYDELVSYKEQIDQVMLARSQGDLELKTGPHCKYCPAAATACPAFNKAFFRGIEVAHEFLQDDITNEELSFQLSLINRVEDVIKIKKDSISQLAIHKLKNGELIPNYTSKIKYGHRKWNNNISPDLIKMVTGVDVLEQVMVSPAKAEKLGVNKEFIKNLCVTPTIGQDLVYTDTSKLGDQIFGDPNAVR